MVEIVDRYYITFGVIKKACDDCKLNNKSFAEPVQVLFFSMCIRKKFSIPISWATTETLKAILNSEYKDFWKRTYLNESLEEDDFSYKNYTRKLDYLQSLIACIPISAGDCEGKIKIVVLDEEEKEWIKKLIETTKIPAEAIICNKAAEEIKKIHTELKEERDNRL